MLEYSMGFFSTLFGDTQPLWVQIWVAWMMLINTLSLIFIKKRLGQIVFAVWNGNAITMMIFFALFGYTRILGMAHILWWTPLCIYLWKVRNKSRGPAMFNYWYHTLFVTIFLSLILDYVDVLRYFLKF